MKRFCLYISLLALVIFFTGCGVHGLIYSRVTTPLDTNMSETPTGIGKATGDIRHLALANGSLNFMWNSAAIGDIAKENGLETVYFADFEELHVLGIWNMYTVHIYGK